MRLISSILALALTTSAALAADTGPLTPGAPAGVKHAQEGGDGKLVAFGLAALALGVIIVAVTQDDEPAPTPAPPATTTSTV